MFLFRRGPSIFLAVAYVLVVAMTTAQECDLPRHEPFVSIPGDVTLVGLYDVYGGPRCTEPRSGGVQRLTAGAWAVTRLNNLSYTYPLKLGFKAYDTCTNARSAFKRVIQSLVDGSYLQDTNCQKGSPIIGFIGPSSATIASPVSAFVKLFNFTHLPLHLDFLDNEIKVSIAVLLQLNWRQVALLSSSYIVSEKFHQASSLANICVSVSEELFSDRLLPQQCQYLYEEIRQSGTRVVVVLGYDFEVVKTLQYAEKCNSTNLYWLTVGLNDADAISDFQMKIISVTTSEQRFPDLEDRVYLEIDGNTSDEWSSHENNSGLHNCFSTGFLAQIRTDAPCRKYEALGISETVRTVVSYGVHLKQLINSSCQQAKKSCVENTSDCQQAKKGCVENTVALMFQQNITALQTEINNTLREAKLQEEQLSRYDILSLVTSSEDGSKFMKVGEFFNEKLKLNSEKLGILHQVQKGWYKIPNFQCDGVGCRCLNRNATEDKTNIWNQWRSETWITIFVTIACMGSLIALAVISFIIWRICRGDTIEGNQGFAVLSLVGIIINYFAILPFAFNPSEALCTLRLLSVGLAYTLLFSPLLVRSLMLATADTDGLPGHVSGLVQSALYFFCVGVQGALSVEYWWLSKMQHFHLVEESGEFSKACILSHDRIFISLAYAILLLVFWIFVSPFCVRNRRNYREGLFFHIASLASLVVWAVWITGFILLAEDLREKLLCLGLVANATVVLVVIFIPRVYKMTTAIALDTANVSLRPVGQLTAPSLTDMTVRSSNVMLYDTVNHAYAPESVMHAVKEEMEASSFDEYDRCSTPSKVTRL